MSWSWETNYAIQTKAIEVYSRMLYERGLVSAAGGNVSARCGENILITGSNVPLRAAAPHALVLCDERGRPIEKPEGLRPSKETHFHLEVYRQRPEIQYVIHAHPTFSILWSLRGEKLPLYTVSAKMKLKEVPLIPESAPGSSELAQAVAQALKNSSNETRAFLMQAHGILAMGETMEECFHHIELLEDSAKIAVFHRLVE